VAFERLYSLVNLEVDIPVEQTNTLEQIGILSYEVCRGQSSRFGLGTRGPTGRRGLHEADVLVDDVQKVQSSAGFEPQQRLFVLRRHVEEELVSLLRCRMHDGKRYGTARLLCSAVEHTQLRRHWT